MRDADLSRLSVHHQNFIAQQAKKRDAYTKPDAKKKSEALGEVFDSKLELEYCWELERERLAGNIDKWWYHPLRFRIARGTTYEPDFMSQKGARYVVDEVKGSWKQKGARDGRTRLEVAAYFYQMFSWRAVTRDDSGIWVFEKITATDAEVTPME